ncbi:MAG: F0F1 ATP synthase subunit delta [Candidatus Wildermuthbacteria bacterium]|nr:F0F1 ATP synthase subunit delta [Candidatus Wildermuthbacteria bacterium]
MRNKKELYARVLLESLQGASETQAHLKARLFKQLLKKRGDLKLAASILKEFEALWKARKGKIAKVHAAGQLPEKSEDALKKKLAHLGYVMEIKEDPGLLAGVAVFLGNDYLIDNSLRGRLRRIRRMI